MAPNFSRRSLLGGAAAIVGSTMLTRSPSRTSASPADLDFASALSAARALRRGDLSSVELTRHVLDRIRRHNSRLNAIVTLDEDAALARARAADEARARGTWWGPLHGVPCTIKDTFETAGMRTVAGAPGLMGHVPARDATAVARLRAAGAVIIGKTNVPEMSRDWQSYNPVFGVTNNPWDLARTPGGSSGGCAVALAAGLSFLSLGSDLGGSIRVPAHFCGVYGRKPSANVVPLRGHIPPPPATPPGPPLDLPVAGPLARSAGDLRIALEVIGGPEHDEAVAYRWSLTTPRGSRLRDYRLGVVLDDPLGPVTPEVADVLAAAVTSLRRAGVHVDEGWPKGMSAGDQYHTYLDLLEYMWAFQLRDDVLDALRRLASSTEDSHQARRARAWTSPHKRFLATNGRRIAARAAWQEYFRSHDAFLLPVAFSPAFPHDHSEPEETRRRTAEKGPRDYTAHRLHRVISTSKGPRAYMDLRFWISFPTLAGLPATTIPAGLTRDSLPVGMQVMGPYLEDATPIDIAARLADVFGGFRPPTGF